MRAVHRARRRGNLMQTVLLTGTPEHVDEIARVLARETWLGYKIAGVLTNRDGEPWVMKCRDMGQAEDWAALAGFKEVSSRRERVGLFTVTLCRA